MKRGRNERRTAGRRTRVWVRCRDRARLITAVVQIWTVRTPRKVRPTLRRCLLRVKVNLQRLWRWGRSDHEPTVWVPTQRRVGARSLRKAVGKEGANLITCSEAPSVPRRVRAGTVSAPAPLPATRPELPRVDLLPRAASTSVAPRSRRTSLRPRTAPLRPPRPTRPGCRGA